MQASQQSSYYRSLEKDKLEALKISKFNFDTYLTVPVNSISELQWWVSNIEEACRYITRTEPYLTIYTDTSLTGWGVTDNVNPSGVFWHYEEITHINVLELKAIFYGIKIYCKNMFSNMSRLCVIIQQPSLTLITWEAKSRKVVTHWQRKSENGA